MVYCQRPAQVFDQKEATEVTWIFLVRLQLQVRCLAEKCGEADLKGAFLTHVEYICHGDIRKA